MLATWVQMLLQKHQDWAVVTLDIRNAFNSVNLVRVLETVRGNPALSHLYPMLHAWMSRDAGLRTGCNLDLADFFSEEEVQQGAGDAMFAFCAAIHPYVVALDEDLRACAGGEARFFVDDGTTGCWCVTQGMR